LPHLSYDDKSNRPAGVSAQRGSSCFLRQILSHGGDFEIPEAHCGSGKPPGEYWPNFIEILAQCGFSRRPPTRRAIAADDRIEDFSPNSSPEFDRAAGAHPPAR
jgi:hypothetical protein